MNNDTPLKPAPEKPRKVTKWTMVALAFELGYIIALPIIILGLFGKYLDARFDSDPYFKLGGVLLAIVTSTLWLSKRFSELFKSFTSKDR